MNRSILIVICDFLLVSLLTFSTDLNHIAKSGAGRPRPMAVLTNEVPNAGTDLASALKLALAEERRGQEQLQQQLVQARAAASQQQNELQQQQALARTRTEENARLQQQFTAAQSDIASLNQQVKSTSAQAAAVQTQLAAAETAAQKESAEAAALRRQLEDLSRKNEATQNEKQQLATQLRVAEVEQRAAADRAALMQQQVQAQRAETAQLAEGFKKLATNSGALTREIRENRAIAPNAIFSELVTNRVQASLIAARTGFLHISSQKDATASTVLVTDGTNIFAPCHVQDTPLTLWNPGTDWDRLTGVLQNGATKVTIRALSFHQRDPRVVMFPVTAAEAKQLGNKIYRISADPYKFQDAVLVGADTGYYGECDFQMLLDMPQYVKLDRSFLRGLVGKFNPTRGDLVFSRTGELLGMMVNGTYCLMIHSFASTATLALGPDVRGEHTGATLSQLYDDVSQLPLRLQ